MTNLNKTQIKNLRWLLQFGQERESAGCTNSYRCLARLGYVRTATRDETGHRWILTAAGEAVVRKYWASLNINPLADSWG